MTATLTDATTLTDGMQIECTEDASACTAVVCDLLDVLHTEEMYGMRGSDRRMQFVAEFYKRGDGSRRRMVFELTGARRELMGDRLTGRRPSVFPASSCGDATCEQRASLGLLVVWDVESEGYRSIPIEGLQSISFADGSGPVLF